MLTRILATSRSLVKKRCISTQQSFKNFFSHDLSCRTDDSLLREIFDQPCFRTQNLSRSYRNATGLFQNRFLDRPEGFPVWAQHTLIRAQALVAKIEAEKDDLRGTIKDLDRLSDMLCAVMDLAEFVRTVHPDSKFVEKANEAYGMLYGYMNILNTNAGLYNTLRKVMQDQTIKTSLSTEEIAVASILLCDFEKSGINLPPSSKEKFVELSSEIADLGHRILRDCAPEQKYVELSREEVVGLPFTIKGPLKISTAGINGQIALAHLKGSTARKKVFNALNCSTKEQLETLETMLTKRAQLSQLIGQKSFAHMTLAEKMSKSPEHVVDFLETLGRDNFPLAMKEIDFLRPFANSHMRINGNEKLNAWDRDYYATQYLESQNMHSESSLSSFFSVGTVIQGLSRLFSRLYGIRFVPSEISPGEVWSSQVQRLDVICSRDGLIGVIYCDLFERKGKSANPAHFTVRCSRRVDDDVFLVDEDWKGSSGDGMITVETRDNKKYQLPLIALVCGFHSFSESPTLLNYKEVETLFHEMGHAVHSMLGRTDFHNIAGTRCATDFVELPSILMEHFASDPQVLKLFARHHRTDVPLDINRFKAHRNREEQFRGWETQAQVQLALLDQAYHSPLAASPEFNSTTIYHDIIRKWGLVNPGPHTSWQTQFGHLVGYGATYYSYLFDRAIAARVWGKLFSGNVLNQQAGEKLRQDVLRWGGGRDPWHCIARVLEQDKLAKGDTAAMKEVGSWGQ
ncbi:Mitochondrial intermediate peptidase [Neolecta irregularis DAH-3]|uniref:Mitochondrial intermediate peptidase n=1 Tax=Neolecta irregularis (strain DAH-3) TaxID=1198029 RepID=A0A1U7LJ09_NEOID|nr:Mitochondrial intermediate peptidase [Neolecta irregularis DAH-3]|eukprot:OLL22637.1 Mitochondrial intermediate peptidase [Neolecta irregularis DAH-3]